MELRVINDKVFVRVSPPKAAVGAAGIIVQRESRSDEFVCTVVACSPEAVVSQGDTVVIRQLPRGVPYDTAIVGDEELLVLRESEVLAVLEE